MNKTGSLDKFEIGFLVGILVGAGSFGGDGRQPHIVVRMHTDHENLFFWLRDRLPGSRLYGPYDHSGRRYYQWMARGPVLRDLLVPLLEEHLTPDLDGRAHARFQTMKTDYASQLRRTI